MTEDRATEVLSGRAFTKGLDWGEMAGYKFTGRQMVVVAFVHTIGRRCCKFFS